MRPTSAAALAVAALLGALVGGSVTPLVEASGRVAPGVPWSTVLTLAFVGMVLFALAWTTWRSLRREPGSSVRPVDPQRAVALLVLGRSCALGGAVVFGGYLAFALGFLGDAAPLPQERLLRGLLAAAAAVLVVAGGMLLERSCRVPGPGVREDRDDRDRDEPDDGPDTRDSSRPPR